MGNCWRMPEDHLSLLRVPSTHYATLTVSSSGVYSSPATSDNFLPKFITLTRASGNSLQASTDLHQIKAAQCRNLVEHLPLINYDEKSVKQTDCAICLIDFLPQEQLRQLPCHGAHVFHPSCIDGWLEKSLTCPHCSTSVDAALLLKFVPHSNRPDEDDDDE